MTQLTKPIVGRLSDQLQERIRQNHEQRITELQAAVISLLVASGRLLNRRALTGTGTYDPPAGVTIALLEGTACGGGGGGAGGGANAAAGAGGASGEYVMRLIGTPGRQLRSGLFSAPTAGGAGGTNVGGAGAAGADASLTIDGTSFLLKGGAGGAGMVSTAANGFALPGRGVVGAVAGAIREDGTQGWLVTPAMFWGGAGGSIPLGRGGGIGDAITGTHFPSGFGCGGGGACVGGAVGMAGAAGGPAVWYVWEIS